MADFTQATVFPEALATAWTSFGQPEDEGEIFPRNVGGKHIT
jgi:hypothetical protein